MEDKFENVNTSRCIPTASLPGRTDANDTIAAPLLLTNSPDRFGYNSYISDYSLETSTADVWINNGYKRFTQYYNIGETSVYTSNFVDPMTTDGAAEKMILPKGRPHDDFYKTQIKHKWIGKQSTEPDSGNVHTNYLFAKILNFQNLQEIKKSTLNINLDGMNFYITKYMTLPIAIYEKGGNPSNIKKLIDRDDQLGETDNPDDNTKVSNVTPRYGEKTSLDFGSDPGDHYLNSFLSGNYVVSGYKYTYTYPGPVKMSIKAIRREWPIPTANNNIAP